MSNLYVPPCPSDCNGAVADVSFSECAPETHYGEVSKLYIAPANFPGFTDVTDLAEWTANLSDTDDNKIRTLIGIGDLPEPEVTETPISGDRVVTGYKKFTLPFEVDEVNDTNYNFLLMLECGGKFLMWFETSDGLLFGGNDGIEISMPANYLIPRERTAVQKIMLRPQWKSLKSPFRCTSPLA